MKSGATMRQHEVLSPKERDIDRPRPRRLALAAAYRLQLFRRSFLQGSAADAIFWIISGVMKIYCPVRDGNRILVRLAGPGDVLGYPALVEPDGPVLQPFEAQALTKCTVAMFSRDSLIKMLEKLDQPTLIRLFDHLNESWSSVVYRLVTFWGVRFGSGWSSRLRTWHPSPRSQRRSFPRSG